MKNKLTLYSFLLALFSVIFIMQDASAQKRYQHLKKARTSQGFVLKQEAKSEKIKEKSAAQEVAITSPVTEELVNDLSPFPQNDKDVTFMASLENKKADYKKIVRDSKGKNLFNENELTELASSLVFSSKALSNSKLGKILSPDKASEMKPGLIFIIVGGVLAVLAIILWVVGTVVFLGSGYNALIYILFIVLGVLVFAAGMALLAVGIVKMIKARRGR